MRNIILRRRGYSKASVEAICEKTRHFRPHVNNRPFPNDLGVVVRWGCTTRVPSDRVVNTIISRVSDKLGFRRLLSQEAPHIIPKTWFSFQGWEEGGQTLPVIVRRSPHWGGRWFWACNTSEAVSEALRASGDNSYITELIRKEREYRIFLVQGRVAAVAEKTPEDREAIAWNHTEGVPQDLLSWDEWPLRAIRIAREAFLISRLHWGAVDVIVAPGGSPLVLEINTSPEVSSEYRQQCLAKCFDWMVENHIDLEIPLTNQLGDWKKFIHPAISNRAILN